MTGDFESFRTMNVLSAAQARAAPKVAASRSIRTAVFPSFFMVLSFS
jgi:hypothetical protein